MSHFVASLGRHATFKLAKNIKVILNKKSNIDGVSKNHRCVKKKKKADYQATLPKL